MIQSEEEIPFLVMKRSEIQRIAYLAIFLMLTYLACSERYEEAGRQVQITTWDEKGGDQDAMV